MRVAGVMTGTSADGIDLVVVELHGQPPELDITVVAHETAPLPQTTRNLVLQSTTEPVTATDYAKAEYYLSDAIAELASRTFKRVSFELMGVHGQTLWHLPPPSVTPTTHQLLNPYKIAQAVDVPVVWDFRRADIAAGGQGAPLAPFGHFCLFGQGVDPVGVLNLGGIANLTVLPEDANIERVRAWDTGPGMMLIDHLVQTHFDVRFDDRGKLAAGGRVNSALLELALAHPYFAQLPPKSCGREAFGAEFASAFAHHSRSLDVAPTDILRTAVGLTAQTVADAVQQAQVQRVVVSGGGARNSTLVNELATRLPNVTLETSEALGYGVEQIEAISFAIMAFERWHGRPANIPGVTGAFEAVQLGSIAVA